MGDFDDGYKNLMRPGGNNWDAFNRGIQQRNHDQAMSDMTRSHQEQTSQWLQSSFQPSPSYFSGAPAAPMSPEESRRWLIGFGIVGALIAAGLLTAALFAKIDAAGKAAYARKRASFETSAKAAVKPKLAAVLASLDPAREARAIERYASQSRCHADIVNAMFRQPPTFNLCNVNAPVPGYLEFSYFKTQLPQIVKQGRVPVDTMTRISVYPFSRYNLAQLQRGGRTLALSEEEAAHMLRLAAMPVPRPGAACGAVTIYRSAVTKIDDGHFSATVSEGGNLPMRRGCFDKGRFSFVG